MKATISWNKEKEKYELVAKGKTIVRSSKSDYLMRLVTEQKHPKILAAKIDEAKIVSTAPADFEITSPTGKNLVVGPKGADKTYSASKFTIAERFDFMEQLIGMVINKSAKSILVTGEGGVGKTYSVLSCLISAGKIDINKLMPSIENLKIAVPDTEVEMETKVMAQINKPKGDYIIIKGHSTAKSLYRLLFENRDRIIIFDDCDSILNDKTSLNLLKAALDSYEERWVSWHAESPFGETDLPTTFKFNGSIIFVSNMSLKKMDDAVKTRCFKVDLSMTTPQRIERMRAVLEHVMPDVPYDHRLEAMNLLDKYQDLTDDVNFRSLMNVISIRVDPTVKDWKKLSKFALTEQ